MKLEDVLMKYEPHRLTGDRRQCWVDNPDEEVYEFLSQSERDEFWNEAHDVFFEMYNGDDRIRDDGPGMSDDWSSDGKFYLSIYVR
jgi:hypothetical protein